MTVIFVHPPKTAGSTIARIMDREYNPLYICNIDGRFYYWSFERISGWPKERLAKIKVFKGHMPFGLHTFLPQPSSYITILRDPVSRTISEYHYRKHLRHPVLDRDAKTLTLEEYVTTVPYNNPQTKMIAGIRVPYQYHFYSVLSSYNLYTGPCTAETLEIAKANLSQYFSLIGLTERFDETLALGKILFGWKIPFYISMKQGPKLTKKDDVSPQQRSLIAECHQFDMELYRFAASLFDEAVAKHAERVSVELDSVRDAKNSGAMHWTYHRIGAMFRRQFIRARCAI